MSYSFLSYLSKSHSFSDFSSYLICSTGPIKEWVSSTGKPPFKSKLFEVIYLWKVHFQRFGEALRGVKDKLAQKIFYMNYMKTYNNDCSC